jgi:hypothetical protein
MDHASYGRWGFCARAVLRTLGDVHTTFPSGDTAAVTLAGVLTCETPDGSYAAITRVFPSEDGDGDATIESEAAPALALRIAGTELRIEGPIEVIHGSAPLKRPLDTESDQRGV